MGFERREKRLVLCAAKLAARRLLAGFGSVVLGNSALRGAFKAVLREGWICGGRFSAALFGDTCPRSEFVWEHRFLGRPILIRVTPAIPISWRAAWLLEVSEREVERFWQAWLEFCGAGGVFFDIGANLAIHSFRFLAHGVRCVLFEPQGACLEYINTTAALNGWSPVVECAVVAEADGYYDFFVGPSTLFSSRLEQWLEGHGERPLRVRVRGTSLDSYCEHFGIDPSLVKIDVEGSEVGVLVGSRRVFSRAKPCCVIESWGEGNRKAVWQWFFRHGYQTPLALRRTGRSGCTMSRIWTLSEFLVERSYNFVFIADPVLSKELLRAAKGEPVL
jgi:FkbM family methyltransferase